jgi:hypothetical protein
MSVKVQVREGDTWDGIAARELGNHTLGREIAGFNAQNETGAPVAGTEILIPHREEPGAAAHDCENCGAPMPARAAYCSQCGARADGKGSVEKKATVAADPAATATPPNGKSKKSDSTPPA